MPELAIYPKKKWTVLVYMAGDNDLESFAHMNLLEMQGLPSDQHLHVVAQFDGRSQFTYRFRLFPGGNEPVGEPLGETNTGDPVILTDFITWGQKYFPAEHTALVIWNHGTGLRNLPADFDYSRLRSAETSLIKETLKHTLFQTTLDRFDTRPHRMRGIAIDATARDYLDTLELQKALKDASLPKQRLDLIGFDACLMNDVEIAYQLRGLGDYMVGSQETEPGQGWPYRKILSALAARPEMEPRQLAQTIVAEYGKSAASRLRAAASNMTLSALDLAQINTTYDLIKNLVAKLNTDSVLNNSTVRAALLSTHSAVKRFRDRDLVDLVDWCEVLRRQTKGSAGEPFRAELIALQQHLSLNPVLVVANQTSGGDDTARIHGLSIYWPEHGYLPEYDKLDFSSTNWGSLARKFLD